MSLFFHGPGSVSVHCPKFGRRFNAAVRIIHDAFDARDCSQATATSLLDEAGFDDIFSSVGADSSHDSDTEQELEDLATGNATCLLQSTFPTLRESYATSPPLPENSLDDDWVQVDPYREQLYSLGHNTYRLF